MKNGIQQNRFIIIVSLQLILFVAQSQAGGIYKWTDKNGRVHFTDKPPIHEQSKEIKVKPNTYSAPPVSTSFKSDANNQTQKKKRPLKVTLYSTEWCGICKRAKAYFRKNGIRYTEYDIEKNEKANRDFKRLGGKGVPLIVSGKTTMSGFSAAAFEARFNPSNIN